MLENSQNMKVQFSVNLIIWFKVLRKLVKLSLTVKTGQTMSSSTCKTGRVKIKSCCSLSMRTAIDSMNIEYSSEQ